MDWYVRHFGCTFDSHDATRASLEFADLSLALVAVRGAPQTIDIATLKDFKS
jgi:hypothetical protein